MNKVKIALLITLWILFTAMLMLKDEKVLTNHQVTIAANSKTSGPFPVHFDQYNLDDSTLNRRLCFE